MARIDQQEMDLFRRPAPGICPCTYPLVDLLEDAGSVAHYQQCCWQVTFT